MAPTPDPSSLVVEPAAAPVPAHNPAQPQPQNQVQHSPGRQGGHEKHTPPPPFLLNAITPLTQGAEALVYTTTYLTSSTPAILKYRPPKPYRHPVLDKRLTKARLLAEARVLVKCRKEGADVPGLLGADWDEGWVVMEMVEGMTVREVLDGWKDRLDQMKGVEEEQEEDRYLWEVMRKVGRAVGRLHEIGVCHGDLTTSNLMVREGERDGRGVKRRAGDGAAEAEVQKQERQHRHRGRQTVSAMREDAITASDSQPTSQNPAKELSPSYYQPLPPTPGGSVVLIDFGLASITVQDEDRAVDLYVLERAFAATHPAAEPLFKEAMRMYGESFKGARSVLKRLEDVRARGRKKSMIG